MSSTIAPQNGTTTARSRHVVPTTTVKRAPGKARKNANLSAARVAKYDEFYTRIQDIENELMHYKQHFKNKVVFCNCDDPEWSNFWLFFHRNFDEYGLKRLVATYYATNGGGGGVLMCHDESRDDHGLPRVEKKPLQGDGDFRSPECVALLESSDIVCTNPPFSLFREFVALLMDKKKKFLVIGSQNAMTTKEVFPLIKGNRIWMGVSKPKEFKTSLGEFVQLGNVCWFTNLNHRHRNEEIDLFRTFQGHEADYPEFDYYKAINVDKVRDIPKDYAGAMGVPITFMENYNPSQFEILDANDYRRDERVRVKPTGLIKDGEAAIGERIAYARILVKLRVNPNTDGDGE